MSVKIKHTYMYSFFGDVYPCEIKYLENPSEHAYQFDVLIPIEYETYEEAVKCPAHLRFCKVDGHVVLAVFSDFKQGFDKKGNWFEQVHGDVLQIIEWEQWWMYTMSKSKGRYTDCHDASLDFLPCAEKWDDIFQVERLSENWGCNIQGLAYSIHCKITDSN